MDLLFQRSSRNKEALNARVISSLVGYETNATVHTALRRTKKTPKT